MSDEEDLELQALQRQLDDAFQTTRPRRGFEDHLWAELQVRRPWWQRVRGTFAGMLDAVEMAKLLGTSMRTMYDWRKQGILSSSVQSLRWFPLRTTWPRLAS